MSNYTKATNFAAKDALSSGDPDKKVKGTEINTEFDAIATAIATKADLNAPTFTGVVTAASGFVGPLTGLASTATKLATARAINGVNFDGTAAISVNTVNSLTFNNGGAGDASGSTFNGSAAKTLSYNSIGAPKSDGTGASGTWAISITGNAATASSCSGNSATATSATTASHIAAGVAGDLLYQSGAGATTKLAIGANTYILTSNGSAPVWTAPGSISVNYATSAGSASTATTAGNITAYSINQNLATTSTPTFADVYLTSDGTLKIDIKPISGSAVDRLKSFAPVEYVWKDTTEVPEWKKGKKDIGFIAQDLQVVEPDLVLERNVEGVPLLSVNYSKVVPLLVKAIQELAARVEALEGKVK